VSGIPAEYGIQGIPQESENGGLPNLNITNLSTLGSNDYLPSDEVSQTLQVTDDITKSSQAQFQGGFEYQHVRFSTLQPAESRGQFDCTEPTRIFQAFTRPVRRRHEYGI